MVIIDQIAVEDHSDDKFVDGPLIFIIFYSVICSEDVEDYFDGFYRIFSPEKQICPIDLLLNLSFFEMLLFLTHKF